VEDKEKGERWSTRGKEEGEMLPLEVIGVLGLVYVFFMVGTLKVLRAKSAVRRTDKIRDKPLARAMAPELAYRAA
jgi:hypothetical protein